jgi:hypothetical protein
MFKCSSDIFEFLCLALFGLEIDPKVIEVLQKPIALPGTFNSSFNHSSLLDQYPEDVDYCCRKVLGSLEEHQCSQLFLDEIQKTSSSIGVDLLNRRKDQEFWLCRYQ